MKHKCEEMPKSSIIYKWEDGDGYPEYTGKWTLDDFGTSGERVVIIIKYCPFCGEELDE